MYQGWDEPVYCEIGKMLKDDIEFVNPKLEVEGLAGRGRAGKNLLTNRPARTLYWELSAGDYCRRG